MLSFYEYITEKSDGRGLTVFDIDETLFQTKAKVKIVKDGEVVRSLDNQEYNVYKLKPGESYDYSEFRSAQVFHDTSLPIERMVEKAKVIIKNATAAGSKVIIITARAQFDDHKVFLATFRKHGIPVDSIHKIETSGSLNLGSSAKNKRFVFHKYLKSGQYDRVRFFDDAMSNITMFKSLAKQYPDTKFEAYLVNHDGSIKKV